jgi:hypothetical protein
MILKYKSMLLVWLLALLQCLVPFLHAHADGLHASGDTHIHFDALNTGAQQAHSEFRVDLGDTPSVSAPSEFKRDQLFSGDDVGVAIAPIFQPATLATAHLHVAPSSYHPAFQKLIPPAQAPPAAPRFL